MGSDRKAPYGIHLLVGSGFPRRQNMLAVADRIAAIDEQELTEGNNQVVSLLLGFQTRVVVTLVAALVLGLGMAFFSTRRILKLRARPSSARKSARCWWTIMSGKSGRGGWKTPTIC
jgi:hypothetical protein